MQRSLYEMDIENSIALAKEEGLEKGLSQGEAKKERQIIQKLINGGKSREEVINFMEQILELSPAQAEKYYQKLTR
ncbi:hypothetical protein [Limosilactobacillus caccae]|uniref:hypothetical protein n=1 Tax=Limosilactobacillus caccae TaxID=1926284 RepID=UPI000971281C|nr:hypothetical protein [Limosilactobacillus caccae]